MPTPADYEAVLNKSVVILWRNMKGEYTAARLTPKHSERVLEKFLAEHDAPGRMTNEPQPVAALEALIEWQAKEIN